MSKQDRQGVRTAAELERKYDLKAIAGLKKAVKLSEEGINKTNKILEDFVISTLGDIENIQKQIDGNITTWYYTGEPTLSNEPASEWITDEIKENHVGDLYYDKATGKAYRFSFSDNEYLWEEEGDNGIAKALAMANAAVDALDSKRRVFTDVPYPPYENGDLWLNELELYVCQISKTESEEYAEGDFIPATKYTDDTRAEQVGEELTVLQGTVTTIKESHDSFKVEVTKTTEEVRVNTNDIEVLKAYLRFTVNGLEIGEEGCINKVTISKDRIGFWNDKDEVLWFDTETRKIHTPVIEIEKEFKCLGYVEVEEGDRINTRWVGV